MMKKNLLAAFIGAALLVGAFLPLQITAEVTTFTVDKARFADLIRTGKEYYQRGRYMDAKNVFHQAVQADPGSKTAWRYYDLSVVFALAEKANENSDLTRFGVSQGAAAMPAPAAPAESSEPEEEEMEFEGC